MLENNRLYRRIQVNNLFRTFSRTYARQTAKAYPQQPSLINHTNKQQKFDRTNIRSCIQQRRNDSLPAFSQRTINQAQPVSTLPKTQLSNHPIQCNAFTQTINSSPEYKNQTYSGNPYLNSLIARRMQSESSQANIRLKKAENFKLKSCVLKEKQRYEGGQEVGDFSLLQLQDREIIKKRSKCHFRSNMGGLLLVRLKGAREFGKEMGKGSTSNIFERYSGTADPRSKVKAEF